MRNKKRSTANPSDLTRYLIQICEIFQKFPPSFIFNMDETPWNFVYKKCKVLAYVNKEEVDAHLPDDFKKYFTFISAIFHCHWQNIPMPQTVLGNATRRR